MQCLMTIEGLCHYINICCCEQEELSNSIIDELSSKCSKLTSISDKYFGGSEDGILKDFTPKAIEKAQNIMKDRITNEVTKKGKTKIGL